MSFFDSMKKTFGLSKDKDQSRGHVLGNKSSSNTHDIFERIFIEEKLGMGINKFSGCLPIPGGGEPDHSWPIITTVNTASEAYRHGVQSGDIIICLDGNDLSSFDDFSSFIVAMARPISITFLRQYQKENSTNATSNTKGATIATSAGSTSARVTGVFKGSQGSSSNPSNIAQLTEEEKALRREQMSSAAQERTQAWDKKVNSSKQSKPNKLAPITAPEASSEPINPETQRIIDQTKKNEEKSVNEMGYNPFKPLMSFSGSNSSAHATTNEPATPIQQPPTDRNSVNTMQNLPNSEDNTVSNTSRQVEGVLPSSRAAQTHGSPSNDIPGEDDANMDLLIAETDDAFAMLLSLPESEQASRKVAVQTVYKMLSNLYQNQTDLKLRSIRVGNKAFQTKIACTAGATELLQAAGYEYKKPPIKDSNAVESVLASSGTPQKLQKSSVTSEEIYLIHDMSEWRVKRLAYTITRLHELIEQLR